MSQRKMFVVNAGGLPLRSSPQIVSGRHIRLWKCQGFRLQNPKGLQKLLRRGVFGSARSSYPLCETSEKIRQEEVHSDMVISGVTTSIFGDGFWGNNVYFFAMVRTSENFEITLGRKLLR
jgi:hypothetical protein